jgi:hypothetical protein
MFEAVEETVRVAPTNAKGAVPACDAKTAIVAAAVEEFLQTATIVVGSPEVMPLMQIK